MKTDSEKLTEMTAKYYELIDQRKHLLSEISQQDQSIEALLELLDNRPKRDFKYFCLGGLTVVVIVALVCWVGA